MDASELLETGVSLHPGLKQIMTELLEPIAELEDIIAANVDFERIDASGYFMPFSNSHTNPCLADTLFEPLLYCGFITELDELIEKLIAMPERLRIHRFVCSLDTEAGEWELDSKQFLDFVLSRNISDANKLGVINCYNNYAKCILEAAELIRPVVDCIRANEGLFSGYIEDWQQDIEAIDDITEFILKYYNVKFQSDVDYTIFPTFMQGLVFGLTIWEDEYRGTKAQIGEFASSYAMVRYLKALASECTTTRAVEILKGLADETRFELLRYINKKPSYGNALADEFNMTQQKVFYHMSKMLVPNIVQCNAYGGKTYYSINKKTIRELVTLLNEFCEEE